MIRAPDGAHCARSELADSVGSVPHAAWTGLLGIIHTVEMYARSMQNVRGKCALHTYISNYCGKLRGKCAWQRSVANDDGKRTWQAAMAKEHGKLPWQTCMAMRRGKCHCQTRMASSVEKQPGKRAWQRSLANVMANMPGKDTWQEHMEDMHVKCAWHWSLATCPANILG